MKSTILSFLLLSLSPFTSAGTPAVDEEVEESQVQFNIFYKPYLDYETANADFYSLLHTSPDNTFFSVNNFTTPSHGTSRGSHGTLVSTDAENVYPSTWSHLLSPSSVQEVCFDRFDDPSFATMLKKTNNGEACLTKESVLEEEEEDCWTRFWTMAKIGDQHYKNEQRYEVFLKALDKEQGLGYYPEEDNNVKKKFSTDWKKIKLDADKEDRKWGRFLHVDKEEGERVFKEGGTCSSYRQGVAKFMKEEWKEIEGGLNAGEYDREERDFWKQYWGEFY